MQSKAPLAQRLRVTSLPQVTVFLRGIIMLFFLEKFSKLSHFVRNLLYITKFAPSYRQKRGGCSFSRVRRVGTDMDSGAQGAKVLQRRGVSQGG